MVRERRRESEGERDREVEERILSARIASDERRRPREFTSAAWAAAAAATALEDATWIL